MAVAVQAQQRDRARVEREDAEYMLSTFTGTGFIKPDKREKDGPVWERGSIGEEVLNAYDMLGLISTNTRKIELFGDSDERFHISGGNDQIPRHLAARIDGQIETGRVLERVTQRADGRYLVSFSGGVEVVVGTY